jgi:anti-sigma regulatory factor (Ser/Thr protein kinase)
VNIAAKGHHETVTHELPLERESTAPAAARRAVTSWLAAAGWVATTDDSSVATAQLVTSELVTNAIRYGLEPITLTALLGPAVLRLEVHDADRRANPELQHPDDRTPGGRGLLLVSGAADEWGWHSVEDGKVVWAEIALA